MESIETLVTQAIAGDKNAVTDLYNRTYHAVYQTVRALIRCDEDTVLDLVQDTYVRGFQHLKELDAPALFPAWIKRIGINTAKNYLKKKKPLLFSDMSAEDDESPELRIEDDCPENLPEVRLDQKETARLLGEILDSLSEEQRVVVTMFYFDNMRVKEIAACLACSENTVKSRLNYGRQRVKEKVEALEKQGTKLYSIAPLPFLVLLFRTMVPAEPDQKILSAVQKRYCSHTRPNGVRAWKTLPAKAVIGTIGTVAAVTAAAVIVPHIVPPTARPGITEVSASVTEAVSYEHITEPILAETEPPAAGSEMMTEEAQAQVMIFFPALLEDIRKAARIPDDAYEKAPGEYDAQYAHLGSGILWFLHHREAGVYTLDFFYREYDTDNDGSAEFLLARGISPGQCAPIAVYDTDGTIIVGDALNQCHFPKDDPEAVPGWLYLDTDA